MRRWSAGMRSISCNCWQLGEVRLYCARVANTGAHTTAAYLDSMRIWRLTSTNARRRSEQHPRQRLVGPTPLPRLRLTAVACRSQFPLTRGILVCAWSRPPRTAVIPALDPQSSASGAEPARPGRLLTRPASSVPRAASVQAAGVAAALAAPPVSVDIESLVTEDDTPVDNMPSEKQQRLLTEPLYSSWAGPGGGRPFLAAANVGVFAEARNPAIVPDVFLSLDVQVADNWWDKRHRSYFVWEFGKPPELVVEIVSNREGNEVGSKTLAYARMGVGYYVIYDPFHRVMREDVRVYRLRDGGYERQESLRFAELRLGLRLWEGAFEGVWWSGWLRWTDEHDVLIPTGREQRQRADQEGQRADQERHRAEHAEHLLSEERRRAERLAALLRQAGIDPERG